MQVDGVMFLNVCVFAWVMIGQRLCADVIRLLLWVNGGDTDGIIDDVMNGCQS